MARIASSGQLMLLLLLWPQISVSFDFDEFLSVNGEASNFDYNLFRAASEDEELAPLPSPLSEHQHSRSRRAVEKFGNISFECDTSTLPQPTAEYPAVLFRDENYNNCSAAGPFRRIRANDFHRWAQNERGIRLRTLFWNSMLLFPGANITFRAWGFSGNDWWVTLSDWKNTASLNLSVIHHSLLRGNRGMWYASKDPLTKEYRPYWLFWETKYDLRVETAVSSLTVPDCGTCYFGQCGVTGRCECSPGYSGAQCQTRPLPSENYPTLSKPLVLFERADFQGAVYQANPGEAVVFALNNGNARQMKFASMRILFNRTVTFMRNDFVTSQYANTWSPGSDVSDIATFFLSNIHLSDRIWYNLDRSIDSTFYVKVADASGCQGCSELHGVCYTGFCRCLPGWTGDTCENSL